MYNDQSRKNKEEKEAKRKIDLKITFIDGGEIVIPDDLWDDYRYDGKFFIVVQDGNYFRFGKKISAEEAQKIIESEYCDN